MIRYVSKVYTEINLAGMSKSAVAQKLSSYDKDRYYIVLKVGKYERNTAHHWVALDYVDTNSGELYMFDPASNSNSVYSLYRVYKAKILEKTD